MSEEKLYILVPTRDRRASLDTLIQSHKETTKGKSKLVLLIDEDQQELYNEYFESDDYLDLIIVIMERRDLAPKLNAAVEFLGGEAMGWGFVGDDCVFVSPNWEEEVYEQLVTYKGFCYCNDLLKGEEVPNNVFIHGDIITKLGFMCPPILRHYYIDNYWKDIGILIHNIFYFDDIVIEHRHHANGKAEKDDLYIQSEKHFGPDKVAFDQYALSGKLIEDAERILS